MGTHRDQREAPRVVVFPGAPFPSYEKTLQNGPEQTRARGVGAAKRTLDGEDRSGTWAERERGRGFQSTMAGLGAAPPAHTGLLAVPSPAPNFVPQSQPRCTLRLTHRFPRAPGK